ncbi:MAG: guanylate kinase [Legionella sp.]
MAYNYPGNLFIVAAPSGGGKTSLVKKLVIDIPDIEVSISHTTREQRPGEQAGVDYFFVDESEFLTMIDAGSFVEYAHVFSHYYGTSVAQLHDRLSAGIDVVLDIDWQGAQQIKKVFTNAVGVFIVPPSLTELKQRLRDRQRDNEDVITSRMRQAQDELSHYHEFDYLIVNDDFSKAADELQAIVLSHRLRIVRQSKKQQELLSLLLSTT